MVKSVHFAVCTRKQKVPPLESARNCVNPQRLLFQHYPFTLVHCSSLGNIKPQRQRVLCLLPERETTSMTSLKWLRISFYRWSKRNGDQSKAMQIRKRLNCRWGKRLTQKWKADLEPERVKADVMWRTWQTRDRCGSCVWIQWAKWSLHVGRVKTLK